MSGTDQDWIRKEMGLSPLPKKSVNEQMEELEGADSRAFWNVIIGAVVLVAGSICAKFAAAWLRQQM